MAGWLEEFWGDMLSEAPLQIAAAWARLSEEERGAVYAHLTRMATEDGWADVQRQAAQAALAAIGEYPTKTEE